MNALRSILLINFCFSNAALVAAANDLEEIAIANAIDGEGVFELQQREALFVPYGEYPHAKGLQKFDRQSGDILVAAFNSLPAKLGRIFTAGVPIYRGHPDVPGRPDSNPAAPAMGWVNGITAENDGVRFSVKWNPDGEEAIGNAHFRFYSPNWLLRPVKGGIQPVKLLSIGLTNNPRIPVPAIANDNNPEDMKLTAILRKLFGFTAENDEPTEAQIDEAAGALQTRIETLQAAANDLETLRPKLTKAEADLTAANDQVSALQGQITAANDAVTAARARFIDLRLAGLVEQTRVLPADRDTVRTELLAIANDADLDTRLSALAAADPKLKTKATTGNLGKQKGEIHAANDKDAQGVQRREAIDQEMIAIANDKGMAGLSDSDKYTKAFNRAAAKHPTLFQAQAKTA